MLLDMHPHSRYNYFNLCKISKLGVHVCCYMGMIMTKGSSRENDVRNILNMWQKISPGMLFDMRMMMTKGSFQDTGMWTGIRNM